MVNIDTDLVYGNSGGKYDKTIKTFSTRHIVTLDKDGKKSVEQVEYLSLRPMGDSKTEHVRRVTAQDKRMFAREYDLFKKGLEQKEDGFALDDWGVMPDDVVLILNSNGVYTMEHFVELTDDNVDGIAHGLRVWKHKAQEYLSSQGREVAALERENKELNSKLEQQSNRVDELSTMVAELLQRSNKNEHQGHSEEIDIEEGKAAKKSGKAKASVKTTKNS